MHCLDQKICPYFKDRETEAWDDVVTCTNMGRSGIQFFLLFCVAAQYKQPFSKANNAHRYVYVCINMCMCVNLSVCLCVCVHTQVLDVNLKSNTCCLSKPLGSLFASDTSGIQEVRWGCWATPWMRYESRHLVSRIPSHLPHLPKKELGHVISKLEWLPFANVSLWVSAHSVPLTVYLFSHFCPVNSYSCFTSYLEPYFLRRVILAHKFYTFP